MEKIITNMFQSYFHQDWMLDYPTTMDGIKFIKERETFDRAEEFRLSLIELSKNTDLAQDFAYQYGGEFKPELEGMSVIEWLTKAAHLLGSD